MVTNLENLKKYLLVS